MTTPLLPRAPIYVVTKGRWESLMTHRALTRMGVPHFLIVEEAEHAAYAARVDPLATLLVLDPAYQDAYETCDDLGGTKSRGPGPARNFAWDHAVASGAAWHWVMDDNIRGFWRLHHNLKVRANVPEVLRAMEDFADRYVNVSMAGPTYYMFGPRKYKHPPFILNTRIYSCNLIRNDVPYRWRGRYNEDTDLSLRMLKDGWVTVEFLAFLQWKMTTQTVSGGNTTEFYAKEGTLPKSQMLVRLHPDVTRLVWKFRRWHHTVDYEPFARNRLRRRADLEVAAAPDEYGMRFEEREGDGWVPGDPVRHGIERAGLDGYNR